MRAHKRTCGKSTGDYFGSGSSVAKPWLEERIVRTQTSLWPRRQKWMKTEVWSIWSLAVCNALSCASSHHLLMELWKSYRGPIWGNNVKSICSITANFWWSFTLASQGWGKYLPNLLLTLVELPVLNPSFYFIPCLAWWFLREMKRPIGRISSVPLLII